MCLNFLGLVRAYMLAVLHVCMYLSTGGGDPVPICKRRFLIGETEAGICSLPLPLSSTPNTLSHPHMQ